MLRRSFVARCAAAAAAAESLVTVKKEGTVAVVTLNRPKALNALNQEIAQELARVTLKLDKDDSVNVIVITGAGRAFVAGADIKMMQPMSFADWNTNNLFQDIELLRGIRKPMIAAVNGFALGGGCELAMMCDFIIASDKAVFGQPEIKLGTIPGLGGTQRLQQLIGKAKAMEWVLTGNQYTAEEAEKAGLVARVVPHDKLLEETLKIATTIASHSRLTAAIAKDCVNKSLEMTLTEGLAYEKRSFHSTFATQDQKEGMKAFTEKRSAGFQHK
jgi:enoyl-CoA hydratase/carnithine racemase